MKIFIIYLSFLFCVPLIQAQQYCCTIPKFGNYINFLFPQYDFIKTEDKVLFQTLVTEGELGIHNLTTNKDTFFDINLGSSKSNPTNFEKINSNVFFTIRTPDNLVKILKLNSNNLTLSEYVSDAISNENYWLSSINKSRLCFFKYNQNNYSSFWTIENPGAAPNFIKDSVFHLANIIQDRNYQDKKLYYSDSNIFITDGTIINSKIIHLPTDPGDQLYLYNLYPDYKGNFIFSALSNNNGDGLYTYDVINETKKLVYNLTPNINLSGGQLIGLAFGKAIFSTQDNMILSYDPKEESIDTLLTNVPGGYLLGNINGLLYFTDLKKIWRTKGTKVETFLVKDFKTVKPNVTFEYYEIKFNNKIYFKADDGVSGLELWSIGPKIDDIQLVKDFDPGSGSGLRFIFNRDSILYFLADSASNIQRFYILDPPYEALQAQIVIDHVPECNKSNTGIIHVEVKGSQGPFKYHWNFNDSPEDYLAFLDSGLYSVTITDGSGKTVTAQVLLKETPSFSTNVVIKNSDVNQNNGQINLTISGSSGPYIYSWSNNLPPNPNQNNLASGIYSCTITDSNGCKDLLIIEVKLKTATNNILPESIKIYPSITQDKIKVENNSGELITIELRDINGVLLSKNEVNEIKDLSIKNQPSSLFIVMVYNNKMQFLGSQKIIKIN